MLDLFIGSGTGHDANGSPVEFFYVSCKKFRREFDTTEELGKWIRAYIANDFKECVKYGNLVSALSEVD